MVTLISALLKMTRIIHWYAKAGLKDSKAYFSNYLTPIGASILPEIFINLSPDNLYINNSILHGQPI
jgi:hypothetical protein